MNVNLILNLNLVVIVITLITTLMVIGSLIYIHFFAHKKELLKIMVQEDEIVLIKKNKIKKDDIV